MAKPERLGGGGIIEAVGAVVQEMLQLKYGVSLDGADFVRKVEGHCRAGVHGELDTGEVPGPSELVVRLNAWRDLRFRSRDGAWLLALRVDARGLSSFEELRQEVRKMPGTPRAVALVESVAETAAPRSSTSTMRSRLQAVAVFREDYVRTHDLVGRVAMLGMPPLVSFSAVGMRTALLLDPHILAATQHGGRGFLDTKAGDAIVPPLREEYASLTASQMPTDEGLRMSPLASEVSSQLERNASWREAPVCPEASPTARTPWREAARGSEQSLVVQASWREVPGTEAADGGSGNSSPAPAQRWMRRLRRSLEHPDAGGEPQLALLQQLNLWLDGSPDMAAAARRALVDAGLHASLVDVVRRASAAGGRGRAELLVAGQACRAIGLGSRDFPEGASAFSRVLAAPAICGLMRRWLANADVQLNAVLALRGLLEEDAVAAADALSAGALQLLRAALAAHPKVAELQRDGTRAAHLLVSHTEEASVEGQQQEEDVRANPRKGLATALLERRAAEQAKPSMVSAAVGWLFSGGRPAAARGPRQGASEPPGCRTSAAPAPCMPQPHGGVPRLDLRSVVHQDAEGARSVPEAAVLAGQAAAVRRATSRPASRPAPGAVAPAHEPGPSSPRDESPHTPPAVRLQRREDLEEEALSAMGGAAESVGWPR